MFITAGITSLCEQELKIVRAALADPWSEGTVEIGFCKFILSLACANIVPILYKFHRGFLSIGYFCRFGCANNCTKIPDFVGLTSKV